MYAQHKGSKLYSPWISLGQVAASPSCMATHKAVRKQVGISYFVSRWMAWCNIYRAS